jgi:hypothetical protein
MVKQKYAYATFHMLILIENTVKEAYKHRTSVRRRSMSRMRSPSYPSVPLSQAIDLAGKIHRTCRTNVITRENAVQEMGYSGLTGRSMKVLSALLQFGLLEKTGKGDVKVTQRSVEILHGIDESDRDEAILEAAYAPQLFRDIHERFPEGVPSESVIRSYLIQQDFVDVAIGPAIKAFMETYRTVQHMRDDEQHVETFVDVNDATGQKQDAVVQKAVPLPATPVILPISTSADLNKINMDIRGEQVAISAILDLRGLSLLEKKITALKLLLAVYSEAIDTDDDSAEDAI